MKKLLSVLSSKALLLWLIAGWTVYYATNAIWAEEAFSNFIGGLSDNPLLQIPYIAFLLSLGLNIARVAAERLKKGPLALAAWILLPIGTVMFFSGYFLSAAFRNHEWMLVGEGETARAAWQKQGVYAAKISPSLKPEILDAGEGEGAIFAYEPKVTLSDGDREYEVGVFPSRRIRGAYYHVLNFGLAPGIRLFDEGGALINEGYLALKILPPGAEDNFELAPYRVVLRLAPDRTIEKGDARAKIYNLKAPSYNVEVYKGEEQVFEGSSKADVSASKSDVTAPKAGGGEGGYIRFDGHRLEFTEPTYWVFLEIVEDPGVLVILAGLSLISLGVILLPLRLIIKIVKA